MDKKIHFILLFHLLIFSCVSFDAFSQQTFTYDSIYEPSPGLIGEALFTYTTNDDGKKIKNGDFEFVREVRDTATQNSATYNLWQGQFNNNIKVGDWEYETKHHTVEISEISEIELNYTIYTEDEIVEISYINGFPNNEFLLESTLYADRQRVKNMEYLKTVFTGEKINGDMEFFLADRDEDIVAVNGRAINGLMEGIWEFNYFNENITETREYSRGILLSLTKRENGEVIQELTFPLSEELAAAVEGDANVELANTPLSLNFSDGYPRNSKYLREQEKGKEVLELILQEIFQFDENIDFTQQLPLGTNRGFYALESEEEDYLEEWSEIEADYRLHLQQINNLEVGNLNLVKNPGIQAVIKWAEKQEELEEYIRPWNNILSREQVEYYDRRGLLVDYAHDLLARDTITVNDEEIIFDYEPEEKGENFLGYIVENFRDRNRVADSLIQDFEVELEELEISNEISAISEEISVKREEIDTLYQQQPEMQSLRNTLYNVKSHYYNVEFDAEFDKFLNTKNDSLQITRGEQIISRLQILEDIHETGMRISERSNELDSLYTEYTFDPFTFNDQVPVRMKKRLYNIVTEDIIDELIERANNTYLKPSEVLKELDEASRMQERLIFLQDKNTKKLERRLRRSNSLREQVELLNNL